MSTVNVEMPPKHQRSEELVARLGHAVRARRLAKGLSQEAFAELAEFDRTYISLIERGERNPSFTNLCRLARALETPPSELLKGIE
jgi:transcriptional regulator with XRE-family HTH domain